MEYKRLGNTDLAISSLGFGLMRLPVTGAGDYSAAVSLIREAINRGINFFDVGTFYCNDQCETVFGQAIRNPDSKIILSGKSSSHQTPAGDWTSRLKNTLRLFGRDSLDIYFIHYLDYAVWENYFIGGKVIEQVERAQKEGLIKYLGFSSHDTPDAVRKLINTQRFDAVILSFNLLNRTYEETIYDARDKGLGVIIMNPLAGGLLTDSYMELPELTDHFREDIATIALNYVLSNPGVHCALSGMQTPEEIERNTAVTLKKRYSTRETGLINDFIAGKRNENLVYCTGCNYCLPCPQGINIPGIIKIWNQYSIIKGKALFNRDYRMLEVTADCCIGCGICIEKCPNAIDIPGVMEKAGSLWM